MEGIHRCLDQLSLVEEAANSSESAYLFRTRLSRLALSCTRMVARHYGLEEPMLPGRFEPGSTVLRSHNRIAACASRLFAIGERLGQRSEPLDERWMGSREELLHCLSELRDLLMPRHSDETSIKRSRPAIARDLEN